MFDVTGPIVLFDGVCNLCNGAVRFIVDRDPQAHVCFASLQSDTARQLLAEFGVSLPDADPGTLYLIENGRLYDRSTAALRIARHLHGLWPLVSVFQAVPAFVRDPVYEFVAARRYRWFGREDACRVPTPEEASRFLA